MARSSIHRTYNIPEKIILVAEDLGLDAMSTGGNVDFICKKVGKNEDGSDRWVILTSAEGGGGPDELSERCELIITLNEDWTDEVGIPLPTTREGLKVMATMHDPYKYSPHR